MRKICRKASLLREERSELTRHCRDKMYMQRDFDLNSVDVCTDSAHVYTDSLKEVFRKTMLNQEIIFQKQVLAHC